MSGLGGPANPADKNKEDALYEDREPKKIIRLITVTAYMISVSFVGVALSIYYIFLWHPPNPRLMHAQAQEDHHESHHDSQIGDLEYLRQEAPLALSTVATLQQLGLLDPVNLLGENSQDDGSSKSRRDVLKNFNAILRAHLEKTKWDADSTESTLEPARLLLIQLLLINFRLNSSRLGDNLPLYTSLGGGPYRAYIIKR